MQARRGTGEADSLVTAAGQCLDHSYYLTGTDFVNVARPASDSCCRYTTKQSDTENEKTETPK